MRLAFEPKFSYQYKMTNTLILHKSYTNSHINFEGGHKVSIDSVNEENLM